MYTSASCEITSIACCANCKVTRPIPWPLLIPLAHMNQFLGCIHLTFGRLAFSNRFGTHVHEASSIPTGAGCCHFKHAVHFELPVDPWTNGPRSYLGRPTGDWEGQAELSPRHVAKEQSVHYWLGTLFRYGRGARFPNPPEKGPLSGGWFCLGNPIWPIFGLPFKNRRPPNHHGFQSSYARAGCSNLRPNVSTPTPCGARVKGARPAQTKLPPPRK